MSTSYIGITGFNSVEQVKAFNAAVDDIPVGYIMYGFTSSNKRLADPTSSGKTSPSLDSLKEMVDAVPACHLPMVHYYTSNTDKLADEIIELFQYCGLDRRRVGLQLNALWPDPFLCRILKRLGHTITLQLPKEVFYPNWSRVRLLKNLKQYRKYVDYALIDPSGGQGKDFNVSIAAKLMPIIAKEIPEIVPGIAGGFSPDNVADRINAIRDESRCAACNQPELHDYCIDAQGKLRENGQLNVSLAAEFVNNALTGFSSE